jgi:hypothetical protein
MNIILELINRYWKFDNNQQPMSSWHDKQDLLKAIEHELQLNKTCSKCVSLCKNVKSKYKHDKFYCLDTGSIIVNKEEHTCEAFQHVC